MLEERDDGQLVIVNESFKERAKTNSSQSSGTIPTKEELARLIDEAEAGDQTEEDRS